MAALPHAVIGEKTFGAFPNPALTNKGQPVSAAGHLINFNKTSSGTFRILQLAGRVCKAVSMVLEELGNTTSSYFSDLAGKFGTATGMMNYARLPYLTRDFLGAVTGPRPANARGEIKRLGTMTEGAAGWGFAISGLTGNSNIKNAASLFDVVGSTASLALACEDWSKAKQHLEHLNTNESQNGPLQERFAETQTEAFWRIVKCVTSIASGALGLLVLGFGGPILPAAALLGISLASTIAAMAAHFAKETSTYELVDFYKVRQPQVLLAGTPAY